MLAELGHYALILALLLSLLLGTVPLLGVHHCRPAWMAVARPAALAQGVCMALAWGCLLAVFAQADFSVRNVAENANTHLPLAYRLAAAWGSHEGSMLLWLVMQSLWMAAVALWGRQLPAVQQARVLAVMGWLAAGFTLFVLVASNPFLRLFPIPAEGRDLNPLLQDPGMVLHPPLLYMGYVGFSVAFAFAMAALLETGEGARDAGWARLARPWTTAAWCCLTLGVALGSWWAYRELGWGGWWFWDPVENAAFMPWLVGTALLHALAMAARRGQFQAWVVLLAIACFSLSLLGTFLVRSGVLSSVHAFAVDPRRGIFILSFLVVVTGGSLALFAWRAPRLARGPGFTPLSREALMLTNTVLLAVAAGSVLLGTFYPLWLEVFGAARISVGPPYFDTVFAPLMVPVVALMALAPLLRWQATAGAALWARARWPLGLAVVAGAAANWRLGGSVWLGLGLALVAWVLLATLAALAQAWQRGGGSWPPRPWWGMLLAHAGVAVFVLGVALVRSQQSEQDLRMAPGEQVAFAGRQLRFDGVQAAAGPNYEAQQGLFTVLQAGTPTVQLQPEKRRYAAMPATPMTEAAIASGWTGDLYLTLGEPVGQGAWTLRVHHKPFVGWIWGGCLLMALGGVLAVSGHRRQTKPR